ncbi:MAG: SH3 domain-containing protein [Microcoleus sp. SIO2G3]|nr:SH3 domain-containing protein [Microcoleus sp. SIO2G3]
MSFSGIAKFFIGFIIGIVLLAGSGAAAAYYFFTKLAAPPPKPIFAEEQPKATPIAKKTSSPSTTKQPTPSASPSSTEELPPGAYKARVTWEEGLSLRDAPGAESNRIGGVAFKQEVIVLRESNDQRWQQVRLAEGTQEGWIKSGNIERVN